MILSLKWLSDYVNIDNLTVKQLADGLTMSGSKVENWWREDDGISKVVVGKILSIKPHPNADKLLVCLIDVGACEPLQVVTGALNVRENALTAVCLDGATLPDGTKIKSGNLRGVLSQGMLCSLSELGLSGSDFPYAAENGIFLIEESCEIGQNISEAIGVGDTQIEFEITSNRPDCLCVSGLARETAATFGLPLRLQSPVVKGSNGKISDCFEARVETNLCSRYMARMVKNVEIKPSPRWIRERLRASNIRPINNIVDITNFVMLEYGHPMHAFDVDRIKGQRIVVRSAKPGESIQTLDKAQHDLRGDILVVCDEENPMAVAGVIGGQDSGVSDSTETIIFECACFDGASVRKAAKFLNIRTDSSARFEKGLNPICCENSINRACELVELLGAGEVVGGTIDVKNFQPKTKIIELNSDWINKFIGIDLSQEDMIKILNSLGFKVDGKKIEVPPFRIDIEDKADIAEEIARIYGYNKISTSIIKGQAMGGLNKRQKFEKCVNNILISLGCSEIFTYSFISPKEYDRIQLDGDSDVRKSIKIKNPLGEDTSIMRKTTLASMLNVLSHNYKNRNPLAWLYEIGKIYSMAKEKNLPEETKKITIGCYGNCDFQTIKGIIETLLDRLHVDKIEFIAASGMPFHDYRCAEVLKSGKILGKFGEVHPTVSENYKIGARVYIAELDFDLIYDQVDENLTYEALPKFPASTRDLSLVCDEYMTSAEIEKVIKKNVGMVLENIDVFDVYRGKQIDSGKKSISYKITMRNKSRTLTDGEVDGLINETLKDLEKIGVYLRS